MLQVVEINAVEHLESLHLRWTSLQYNTPGASFFHTLDWLKVYWQHFGGSHRLRVLVVHRGGNVFGIMPLVAREQTTAARNVVALTYPTLTPSHACGPVGPNPTATLMASLRYLSRLARDWDVLALPAIKDLDDGRTANAMELAGFHPNENAVTAATRIRLNERLEECLAALDHDAKLGECVTFERYRPLGNTYGEDESLALLIDECIEIHWRGASTAGATPELSEGFLRDAFAAAMRRGMLDLNLLRQDNRLIAFSFNVHFDRAIQQICLGASSSPLAFDPKAVLTSQMLRDSYSREDRCIDFLGRQSAVMSLACTRELPAVCHRHVASIPFRTRLTRMGKRLVSPLTNA
ncbi:MAG: GNAT family N-acetyltransferase [Planctomycetes bacterium]|nr:GNAT family N-acetyltransferase [Planctomycetota bacterium]